MFPPHPSSLFAFSNNWSCSPSSTCIHQHTQCWGSPGHSSVWGWALSCAHFLSQPGGRRHPSLLVSSMQNYFPVLRCPEGKGKGQKPVLAAFCESLGRADPAECRVLCPWMGHRWNTQCCRQSPAGCHPFRLLSGVPSVLLLLLVFCYLLLEVGCGHSKGGLWSPNTARVRAVTSVLAAHAGNWKVGAGEGTEVHGGGWHTEGCSQGGSGGNRVVVILHPTPLPPYSGLNYSQLGFHPHLHSCSQPTGKKESGRCWECKQPERWRSRNTTAWILPSICCRSVPVHPRQGTAGCRASLHPSLGMGHFLPFSLHPSTLQPPLPSCGILLFSASSINKENMLVFTNFFTNLRLVLEVMALQKALSWKVPGPFLLHLMCEV